LRRRSCSRRLLVLIILGSAFTIVFWAKWLGTVLTVYKPGRPKIEDTPIFSVKLALAHHRPDACRRSRRSSHPSTTSSSCPPCRPCSGINAGVVGSGGRPCA
jgi:hypothetical protein